MEKYYKEAKKMIEEMGPYISAAWFAGMLAGYILGRMGS